MAYVEDLTAEQVRRGHEVTYLFSGRQYPYLSGPRLRRWERGGVTMLEIVNSPLYDHGRQPELELDEPKVERVLEGVLAEVRPDVVHVQELAGLPSSALEIVRRSGTPAVMTLHDYFLLCSTFKLFDAEGRVCLRRQVGADCAGATAADSREPGLLFEATLMHHLSGVPLVRRVPAIRRIARFASRRAAAGRGHGGEPAPADRVAAFERRRKVNLERLSQVDCLLAVSPRVAEIYSLLGVDPSRLRALEIGLAHIQHLRPRHLKGRLPVTFATLGGLESLAKGGRILLDALRHLSAAVEAGRCRLLVFGFANPMFSEEVERLAGVEIRGPYRPEELDGLLDEVDVGIMPSIWEEAYGFAGVEFLAKGIPVIANAIGGMIEYTREGETGWLNRSCSAQELARIMSGVTERPEQIAELNLKLRADRDSIVKPMACHGAEIDAVYSEVIGGRSAAG